VSDDASETWDGPIVDEPAPAPIRASQLIYDGSVWSVRRDTVQIGAVEVERDVIIHPGAVAVIALDDDDRVLLIRQYRHPVASFLFEPPAGLLDTPGEDPLHTAKRELAEEAGYAASTWFTLVDLLNSPGGTSEGIRVYLARDVTALPDGRQHTNEAEEAHLPRAWIPLTEASAHVLAGAIQSPTAVCGILAAMQARESRWSTLRAADAAWPTREALVENGRVHNRSAGNRNEAN